MRSLLIILFLFILVSCKIEYPATEDSFLRQGVYSGSFQCDTILLWESIGITGDRFEEYPSGGMWDQKYRLVALTKGNYKILDTTISFYNIQIAMPHGEITESFKNEFLLSGDYIIDNYSDSTIKFWKYSATGKQEYNLRTN